LTAEYTPSVTAVKAMMMKAGMAMPGGVLRPVDHEVEGLLAALRGGRAHVALDGVEHPVGVALRDGLVEVVQLDDAVVGGLVDVGGGQPGQGSPEIAVR
jgi:hypothetical protein